MADRFEAELEALVQRTARELAREITALILRRLGITDGGPGALPRGRPPARVSLVAPARAAARPTQGPKRRRRATSTDRSANADRIATVVATTPGLSAGDIEKASGLSRAVVDVALRTLKEQGRVFMGGTRRFARYATTQAAADRASAEARRAG